MNRRTRRKENGNENRNQWIWANRSDVCFGRLKKGPDLEFVAINDLTDAATLAHLLKYDSVTVVNAKVKLLMMPSSWTARRYAFCPSGTRPVALEGAGR